VRFWDTQDGSDRVAEDLLILDGVYSSHKPWACEDGEAHDTRQALTTSDQDSRGIEDLNFSFDSSM
jgi:hypothetical protein